MSRLVVLVTYTRVRLQLIQCTFYRMQLKNEVNSQQNKGSEKSSPVGDFIFVNEREDKKGKDREIQKVWKNMKGKVGISLVGVLCGLFLVFFSSCKHKDRQLIHIYVISILDEAQPAGNRTTVVEEHALVLCLWHCVCVCLPMLETSMTLMIAFSLYLLYEKILEIFYLIFLINNSFSSLTRHSLFIWFCTRYNSCISFKVKAWTTCNFQYIYTVYINDPLEGSFWTFFLQWNFIILVFTALKYTQS